MGERRLFYALNKESKRTHVDHLTETDRRQHFYCPHCKTQVIPKMGEEKTWHFAHVEETCAALKKIGADDQEGSLLNFQTEDEGSTDVTDSLTFLCPLCKQAGRKEHATKLQEQVYVHRSCYTSASSDILARLL